MNRLPVDHYAANLSQKHFNVSAITLDTIQRGKDLDDSRRKTRLLVGMTRRHEVPALAGTAAVTAQHRILRLMAGITVLPSASMKCSSGL